MWPRPLGRGNNRREIEELEAWMTFNVAATSRSRKFGCLSKLRTPEATFNVAATSRSRKCTYSGVSSKWGSPSMWPRPLGRGNAKVDWLEYAGPTPSMWPRPLGRGNIAQARYICISTAPSMWPRPLGRGNSTPAPPCRPFSASLQCGRDLSVAEMMGLSAGAVRFHYPSMWPRPLGRGNLRVSQNTFARPISLQCGRDLSVAEMS